MNRIIEAIDFESDTKNWKYSFKIMSKKYGREFIETLKAMCQANGGGQTEKEFCDMNEITIQFFDKVVKCG
tara:strand:+ start:5305 stop:5517 length:213 start_codon:yes stop_codon:yes gene_type:complete